MKRTMNQKHFFAPTAWRLGGASLRRAAITLLLLAVVTTTAWAQDTEPVSYIDADGTADEASAIALDGTETSLAEGWYFVGNDISYTQTLTLGGDVNLILADGKTMSVSGVDRGINADDGTLTIYGQTLGTGTLNGTATNGIGIYTDGIVTINGGTVNATGTSDVGIRSVDGITINGGTVTTTGIMADGDVTISGGKFTATDDPGISSNDGTVTLGWTSADDFINADSYQGTVKIASGKSLHNGSEVISGTIDASDFDAKLNGMTLAPAIVLADAADNTTAIATAATACTGGKTLAVQLQGRTLYKDGAWNTLCLPFSMDAEQVTAQLAPAALMTLKSSAFAGSELTLTFEDATTIEAGKPYIIKWDATTPDYIENPEFTGVTISNATSNVPTSYADFIGTYSPITWESENKSILFLGGGNTLYYPQSGAHLGACRAYFRLKGLVAGDIKEARMYFEEDSSEATIISPAEIKVIAERADAAWYTLDGRKLNAKPTKKGLYIFKGKKVKK